MNLNIKSKLFGMTVVLLVLMVAVGVTGLYGFRQSNTALEGVFPGQYEELCASDQD